MESDPRRRDILERWHDGSRIMRAVATDPSRPFAPPIRHRLYLFRTKADAIVPLGDNPPVQPASKWRLSIVTDANDGGAPQTLSLPIRYATPGPGTPDAIREEMLAIRIMVKAAANLLRNGNEVGNVMHSLEELDAYMRENTAPQVLANVSSAQDTEHIFYRGADCA